jgi:hypothetical protein
MRTETRGLSSRARKSAALSGSFERAQCQRLGYLLEKFGHGECTDALFGAVTQLGALPWVELEPAQASDLAPEVSVRDARWHVIVRWAPEPES